LFTKYANLSGVWLRAGVLGVGRIYMKISETNDALQKKCEKLNKVCMWRNNGV